jgi:hypothetical protein
MPLERIVEAPGKRYLRQGMIYLCSIAGDDRRQSETATWLAPDRRSFCPR